MALPQVLYPPPTRHGFGEWLFAHFQHHQAIINATQTKFKQQLVMRTIYPINPADPQQVQIFLEQHQQMHDDMAGVLRIQQNDLAGVNFNKKKEMDAWFMLNYFEHLAAATNLGGGV